MLLDPRDPLHLFLDANADALFHLLGGRTEIRNGDRDDGALDVWKRLDLNPEHRSEPAEDEHEHQQVRSDVVPREPGDGADHRTPEASEDSSSRIRTRMPSTTAPSGAAFAD